MIVLKIGGSKGIDYNLIADDVAVLGVDNDPLCCELAPVPLTSVDNNRKLHGYEAAKLLEEGL